MSKWLTIPIAPNYEMSPSGTVRHAQTKRLRKISVTENGGRYFCIWAKGRRKKIYTEGVKYFLFGEAYKCAPVPVIISKGRYSRYFESLRQCAAFLATKTDLNCGQLKNLLFCRRKEIEDWQINYQR